MTVLALIIMLFASASIAKDTIKYAAVIYRHGDRTPVDTYPTDPWQNQSLWPVKFGELTNAGKIQHYALGQWLRKRYSHLLSSEFNPSQIYVKSTDVDRTLMSAQANLAGMYPPVGKSVWNDQLMWQPIPVHTEPVNLDYVLAMQKKCPAYDKEMDRFVNSKAYKDRLSQYQDLMNYLTAYTGKKIKDCSDIMNIYSTLYIEQLYNFTLPDWTHSVFPDKMREPSGYSFTVPAATPLLARLRVGPLIKEIFTNIWSSCTNRTENLLKVIMYSGHDLTVGAVLTALGMFDGNCPQYTATILIEVVNDNTTSATDYIRISYRNSVDIVEPVVLDIPYCGKKCPVERFAKLYANLLTVNFDYECTKQINSLLGISFLTGLVIFAMIYLIHKICFAKFNREREPDFIYSNITATNSFKAIQL